MCRMSDADSRFTFTYDSAGHVTAVSHSHDDGLDGDCIPTFDADPARPAYECLACGAGCGKPVVGHFAADVH